MSQRNGRREDWLAGEEATGRLEKGKGWFNMLLFLVSRNDSMAPGMCMSAVAGFVHHELHFWGEKVPTLAEKRGREDNKGQFGLVIGRAATLPPVNTKHCSTLHVLCTKPLGNCFLHPHHRTPHVAN